MHTAKAEEDEELRKTHNLSHYTWWSGHGGVAAMRREVDKGLNWPCRHCHTLEPTGTQANKCKDPATMPEGKRRGTEEEEKQYDAKFVAKIKYPKQQHVDAHKRAIGCCALCARPVVAGQEHAFPFDHRDPTTKMKGKDTLAGVNGGVAGLVQQLRQGGCPRRDPGRPRRGDGPRVASSAPTATTGKPMGLPDARVSEWMNMPKSARCVGRGGALGVAHMSVRRSYLPVWDVRNTKPSIESTLFGNLLTPGRLAASASAARSRRVTAPKPQPTEGRFVLPDGTWAPGLIQTTVFTDEDSRTDAEKARARFLEQKLGVNTEALRVMWTPELEAQLRERGVSATPLTADERAELLDLRNKGPQPVRRFAAASCTHVSPYIGIAPARNNRGVLIGNGLFPTQDIEQDEFVGFFTGLWALERDIAAVFPGDERRCVNAYAASARGFFLVNDEIKYVRIFERGGSSDPSPAPDTVLPEVKCADSLVHDLICMPRMSSEGVTQAEEAQRLCALAYSPYGPNFVDVMGLVNTPRMGGKGRTREGEVFPTANLEAVTMVVFPDGETRVPHITIGLFAATRIPAGKQMLWNYQYRRGTGGKGAEYSKSKWNPTKHSVSIKEGSDTWAEMLTAGQKAKTEVASWGRGVSPAWLGPKVKRVACASTTGKLWTGLVLPTSITNGAYLATLKDEVLNSDGTDRALAVKAWSEAKLAWAQGRPREGVRHH